ncbi:2-C-methyl-D-erythritol 4-phosphate cytidylyltransferase [Egicoccus halophilus]|uniref:2-C-methyl-D-erythritol 4-phosphate cytidylyltransferase n=1 Tax=Egicoccus halophilus TaxID=1670830 RepID=A0A8J3A9Q8_9ACTN|nr:2-C-methyl-D-erythritol 4-phosphate cytidylyltransferase [Egicoccus halophilus]GGI07800.1 2-C-methyl-D-erythritol 4-phosphate cytidylyltransferase [Egicoccus halophilus]
MTFGVVVVAAGRGERLGHDRPKALVELAGRPLVHHAVAGLAAAGLPPPVVVCAPGEQAAFRRALAGLTVAALVAGGEDRTASVAAGLAVLPEDVEVVLVHDAARALVPADVIRQVAAAVTGDVVAAAPGVPVSDTLKRVVGSEVVATVAREGLVAVQTPQAFDRAALAAAHATGARATDDLALVEALVTQGRLPGRVVVTPGAFAAMKVTFPADLVVAEALLRAGPQ